MQDIFIGRQPIFDGKQQVFGYELLFRSAHATQSGILSGHCDEATHELLLNAFSDFSFDELVGGKLGFVNFTKNLILNPPSLPPNKVVIEILEEVQPSEEVLVALRHLKEKGFKLALDDVVYQTALEPFFNLVEILKIDLIATPREKWSEHVRILKSYPVKLLAEKVQTEEEFEYCKKLGFDLFQGFFLSRPKLLGAKRTETNKMVVVDLLGELQNPNTTMGELEAILSQDPRLGFKLMKIINSAAYARPKKVQSLKKALIFLGLHKLKEWLSLIVLTSFDQTPSELIKITIIRAKMCELVAAHKGFLTPDAYFTAGLFSSLDVILDQPLRGILHQLSLEDKIKEGILEGKGEIGKVLHRVMAYEKTHWSEIPGTEVSLYVGAYKASIRWAALVYGELFD